MDRQLLHRHLEGTKRLTYPSVRRGVSTVPETPLERGSLKRHSGDVAERNVREPGELPESLSTEKRREGGELGERVGEAKVSDAKYSEAKMLDGKYLETSNAKYWEAKVLDGKYLETSNAKYSETKSTVPAQKPSLPAQQSTPTQQPIPFLPHFETVYVFSTLRG